MTAKQFRHGGENLAVRYVSWVVAWWQKASGGFARYCWAMMTRH